MQRSQSHREGRSRWVALCSILVLVAVNLVPFASGSVASASESPTFITVAVVVEIHHHQTVRCVTVRKGASALQILDALSQSLGWPPPTTDVAWPGFICSIKGTPFRSTSCLSKFDPKESTWGFWLGEGPTWRYATMGAASTVPKDHDVEGWVLEPGTAMHATIVSPSITTNFSALCGRQTSTPSVETPKTSSHVGGALAAVGLILGLGSAGIVIARRRREVS
jgi:LPXTG-motif cell wall-anchored protein